MGNAGGPTRRPWSRPCASSTVRPDPPVLRGCFWILLLAALLAPWKVLALFLVPVILGAALQGGRTRR